MSHVPIYRNHPRNPQFYDPFATDMWNPCCEFNDHTMFPPPPHFPFHNNMMTHAPPPPPPPPHFPFPNNMMNHAPHFPFHNNMMSHALLFCGGSGWRETADAHLVAVELPGFKKEEVKVKVEDGGRVLEIRGEKEKEREEKHENWRHFERSNGSFFRTFSMPENCKADHVKSSMEHGVLTVTVPKRDVHKMSESHHGNKFDHVHKMSESHHGNKFDHAHNMSEPHHRSHVDHVHRMSESHHGNKYDHAHNMSEPHHRSHVDHAHRMSEPHHGNKYDHAHKISEPHHGNHVDHLHRMSESHGKTDDVHKISESHARKFDFRKISESHHGNKVEIKD